MLQSAGKGLSMTMYYSKNEQGFYPSELLAVYSFLPEDLEEISLDDHRALLEGQSTGKVIDWSGDKPALADPQPPSVETLASQARLQRDNLLALHVDTLSPIRWVSLTDKQKEDWSKYRQDLLDVPQQKAFPKGIKWPELPK